MLFRKIILLFILTVFITNCLVTNSIYKRNDYDYPRVITYPYKDLLKDLEKLRELNDTNINKILDEIQEAVANNDYNRLLELLKLLQQYLNEKGYIENNEYVSILTKLLKSVDNAGPFGLEIKYESLDPYLKNLFEQFGLRELVMTINIEKLLELFEKYTGSLSNNVLSESSSKSSNDREFLNERLLPSISNNPLPSVFGGLSLPVFSFPSLIILILITTISIALLVVIIKYKKVLIPKITSNIEQFIVNPIEKLTRSFKNTYIDPVISLYNKWYLITKQHGYRREYSETLREYLKQIRENKLSDIGLKVTSLYEERIYGSKEINREVLSSLESILNKTESREN